jgi:hypothetical protein
MNRAGRPLNSQTLCTVTSGALRVGLPAVVSRPARIIFFRRCISILFFGLLAACATHRSEPPQCKGPFTPINLSSSVAHNGPQR